MQVFKHRGCKVSALPQVAMLRLRYAAGGDEYAQSKHRCRLRDFSEIPQVFMLS